MQHFDYLVFIGRFQPFHNGHHEVLSKALRLARKIIVVLGSARRPRTIKDPWTIPERTVMASACFSRETDEGRILFASVVDRLYNDQQWAAGVQAAVGEAIGRDAAGGAAPTIGLIGHGKDRSSFYLRMFPQWERVEAPNIAGLSATDIRRYYFERDDLLVKSSVPKGVFEFLTSFRQTPMLPALTAEYEFIRAYKAQFAGLKYPPVFVTTDAVVVQSGHVLLIRRGAQPGAGLWALPGGFLRTDERIVDGMLRELREETRLKAPELVLRGSIKGERVFDHPDRSLRGRTITHAFLIELPEGPLHPVKGADDAAKAQWLPIAQVVDMDEEIFEDHLDIVRYFLGSV
jgi:bifunctional NMN adenylyltransferase/nudix hydrolase